MCVCDVININGLDVLRLWLEPIGKTWPVFLVGYYGSSY